MQLGQSIDDLLPINGKISVFHSATATFYAPSDPSGTHGIQRERIRSTPSWRGRGPRRDCAFIVEDETKPGMGGMAVARAILSPSGRGVASVPNRVRVSHAGPVGTAEDLSSETTKSRYHVMSQVIRITCEIT